MISAFGRFLIFLGIVLFGLGIIFVLGERIPWLGKLPGDILIKKNNFSLYFPLATCLLLSILLSFILWFVSRFMK
ncbi:MAG: DUF2905 domain-containing protein [Candidatus Omnitrophica bacterium]|nr:DUF2905 domain-containing protein [Candidatus Omnitrophota bacterium]